MKILTCLFIVLFWISPCFCQEQDSNPQMKTASKEDGADSTAKQNIADLVFFLDELAKEQIEIQAQLEQIPSSEAVRKELPSLRNEFEQLAWEVMMMQTDPDPNYSRLSEIQTLLNHLRNDLADREAPLREVITRLDHWDSVLRDRQQVLLRWIQEVEEKPTFSAIEQSAGNALKNIDNLLQRIRKQLAETIKTEQQASTLRNQIRSLGIQIRQLAQTIKKTGIQQTSPLMFSPRFFSAFNSNLFQATAHQLVTIFNQQVLLFRQHGGYLLRLLAAPLVMALLLIRFGAFLGRENPRWSIFIERPLSFSLFFCLLLSSIWFWQALHDWQPIIRIILTLSLIRLLEHLEPDQKVRRFMNLLCICMVSTTLIRVFHLPVPLMRLYIFSVSLAWFVYCGWRSLVISRRGKKLFHLYLLRLGLVLLGTVLVAVVAGYDELADYIFWSSLLTIMFGLGAWMIFYLAKTLIEVLLHHVPIPVVRQNTEPIMASLQPALIFLCCFYFIALILVAWRIYPTVEDSLRGIFTLGFSSGSWKVTGRVFLIIIAVLYTSLFLSKGIRALLKEEILPRYHVEEGVAISITRLVHYLILGVGCIVLLRILGFELTRLAILGGALSVGIGFGLQAIVNNFVSGLILLFERPIKVGDTIELDGQLGEVKKLGLRATIVQTVDNAEIVVPNGDLITSQVTNWTLAERKARITVSVGVAYGSDIGKVLEILKACAEDNPMVLSHPRPVALFLAFGDSSLDFELRVWIEDFSERLQVLSELNQDIAYELQQAGIEIPFPQSDLHLRSIDEAAVNSLGTLLTEQEDRPRS